MHSTGPDPSTDFKLLLIALGLIAGFVVVEIVAAVLSNSLALLADAGHMTTDVIALAASAWALRLARQPARGRWTYGLKRAEILSAAGNGVALVVMAIVIAIGALERLASPHEVVGRTVLTVAVAGGIVNVVATWVLAKANRSNLNLRSAYLHVVTDLYAFIGTAIAGVLIIVAGWNRADSVASLFVVALMLSAAYRLLRDSGRILLQGAPEHLDLDDIREHLCELDYVLGVHDLHVWTVTSGDVSVAAHVVVQDHCFESGQLPVILDSLQQCLSDHFEVMHATFQLEPERHEAHEDGLHP